MARVNREESWRDQGGYGNDVSMGVRTDRMEEWLTTRWRVGVVLLLAAFAIRGWDFGNPVIHVDEQYYLLVGDRMLHGALPYVEVWDRKPIGLFAIYAAIRLLPGDGIVAYQVAATLFAAGTALAVARAGRMVGATRVAAVMAGCAYLLWLPLLSGRGGQSPVFYDLFVTWAAVLTLRVPKLANARAIVVNGAAACALAGLAIQTKYTPAVEGALFGLLHLIRLWRVRAGPARIAGAAVLWIALGVAPTLVVVAAYAAKGAAAFDAFWFANFASIALRRGYPAAKIAGRLAGTWAQLAPLVVFAGLAWRLERVAQPKPSVRPELVEGRPVPSTGVLASGTGHPSTSSGRTGKGAPRRTGKGTPRRTGEAGAWRLAFAWLVAALVGWASVGAFFDHYALVLIAPLAIVASPAFARYPRWAALALAAALATGCVKAALRSDDRAEAYAVAAFVARNSGTECPYVFAGDSITYHLAHACLPTRFAFPSTLAYAPEQGATGVDEAGEVARIMARRPPVVVTLAHPLAAWNRESLALMAAALSRDYALAMRRPRDGDAILVYLRKDRHLR